MEPHENGYRISFFKPTTEPARFNRNLIIILVSIWALAVFGFHIVLRIIEKPTPEPALQSFEEVWTPVSMETASTAQYQQCAEAVLTTLAKPTLIHMAKNDDRTLLINVFTALVYKQMPAEQWTKLEADMSIFEASRESLESFEDPDYLAVKSRISGNVADFASVSPISSQGQLIPFNLDPSMNSLVGIDLEAVHMTMKKYLTHNRSVLTDTRFLGFPFHYFYTAVFLLILFVGLCWVYCVVTDRMHTRLEVTEKV